MNFNSFLSHLQARKIRVTPVQDQLEVEADEQELTAEVLENFRRYKVPLLARLRARLHCPVCFHALRFSSAYHGWCEAGHYDVQYPIPAAQRQHFCRLCHGHLLRGVCGSGCPPQTVGAKAGERLQLHPANQDCPQNEGGKSL